MLHWKCIDNGYVADMLTFHGLLPSSYIRFCTNKWLNWEEKCDYFFTFFATNLKKIKLIWNAFFEEKHWKSYEVKRFAWFRLRHFHEKSWTAISFYQTSPYVIEPRLLLLGFAFQVNIEAAWYVTNCLTG